MEPSTTLLLNKRRVSHTYFSLSHLGLRNTSGTPSHSTTHFNKRGVYHTFLPPSLLSHTPHVEPPTILIKEGSITLSSLFRFFLMHSLHVGTLNHINKRRVSHTCHISPFHLLVSHTTHVEPPTTLIKEVFIIHFSLSHFFLMHYMWNPAPTTLIKEGSITSNSTLHE